MDFKTQGNERVRTEQLIGTPLSGITNTESALDMMTVRRLQGDQERGGSEWCVVPVTAQHAGRRAGAFEVVEGKQAGDTGELREFCMKLLIEPACLNT